MLFPNGMYRHHHLWFGEWPSFRLMRYEVNRTKNYHWYHNILICCDMQDQIPSKSRILPIFHQDNFESFQLNSYLVVLVDFCSVAVIILNFISESSNKLCLIFTRIFVNIGSMWIVFQLFNAVRSSIIFAASRKVPVQRHALNMIWRKVDTTAVHKHYIHQPIANILTFLSS